MMVDGLEGCVKVVGDFTRCCWQVLQHDMRKGCCQQVSLHGSGELVCLIYYSQRVIDHGMGEGLVGLAVISTPGKPLTRVL